MIYVQMSRKEDDDYQAHIYSKLSFVPEVFYGLDPQASVGFVAQMVIHPELIACLIMRLDQHILDIPRVHPVYSNIDWNLLFGFQGINWLRDSCYSSGFLSHICAFPMMPDNFNEC